jgi:membrane-anchored protein YejM (alkaline phosphatase superfamily)
MDNSLRKFFDEARKQPWFDNTLFIITADHSGPGLSPEYLDYDGSYRIPMIVYDPQNNIGNVDDIIVQQTDLFPSLVRFLGFDDPVVAFGQNDIDRGWQVYFGNDYFCMVSNNPRNPKQHDITILCGSQEIGSAENIRFLKAVVQQYFLRVMNNKLIAK